MPRTLISMHKKSLSDVLQSLSRGKGGWTQGSRHKHASALGGTSMHYSVVPTILLTSIHYLMAQQSVPVGLSKLRWEKDQSVPKGSTGNYK
eukprot:scaffold171684_cov21-Tisochrysis_lutea.AAC.2